MQTNISPITLATQIPKEVVEKFHCKCDNSQKKSEQQNPVFYQCTYMKIEYDEIFTVQCNLEKLVCVDTYNGIRLYDQITLLKYLPA